VLFLGVGRSDGTSHRTIEAAQLTSGARVHITHPGNHGVRLIVEIEAVCHQLLKLDLGRTFEAVTPRATAAVAATGTLVPITVITPALLAAIATRGTTTLRPLLTSVAAAVTDCPIASSAITACPIAGSTVTACPIAGSAVSATATAATHLSLLLLWCFF